MVGGPVDEAALRANLVWYRRQQVAGRAFFGLPIIYLYLVERVGLSDALVLAAVYYLSVVVLEVPSGWFSDRFGRVTTLRISAGLWIVAHSLFAFAGESFGQIALAEACLAAGFAFSSGTDVSFHFDTLDALGRADEFERRQGSVARDGFAATAVAALVGGALGAVDLRLPFAASLLAATVQLAIASRLVEPPRVARAAHLGRHVLTCARHLRTPLLAWLFLYAVAQVTMEHLTSDLTQPYLARALGESAGELIGAPLYAGLLVAVVSVLGSVSAATASRLRARLGLVGALLLLAAVQAGILAAMATVASLAVLPLLALRSVQTAGAPVLTTAAAVPGVPQSHRATLLSLGSLGGRLGYGLVLLSLSTLTGLTAVLRAGALVSLALLGLLVVTAGAARPVVVAPAGRM